MTRERELLLEDKLNYLDNTKEIIKTALIEQGAEVSEEATFRDYAEIIKELSVGDVMLFSTVDEMENYDKPKEGMLALVYREYYTYLSNEDKHYIILPEEVVLPEEVTYSDWIGISSGSSTIGSLNISPTSCNIYIEDTDKEIDVMYTSEDGIHYLRATDITNPIYLNNPIRFQLTYYSNDAYDRKFKYFILCEDAELIGLYKYIDGEYKNAINQLNLSESNQILTGYSAYGNNGIITGDGSYISNIPVKEYINKYLSGLTDNSTTRSIIQSGTKVNVMEYVQRQQIKSDDAFTTQYPQDDSVIQIAEARDVVINVPQEYKVIIQGYLNAKAKYNYAFFIDDVAYRLYLGYNYSTKEQLNAANDTYQTVPYQMTSLYAFIVNLEDLSIYRTFTNADTWAFVNNGSGGNILNYAYSVKSDCLVLLSDLDGWANSGGAYIGLTTITPSGVRNTQYYTINYSCDYDYKKIDRTSYDNEQDCYYLAYLSANKGWTEYSTKRICKLTPSGTLSSIYESSENMKYISSLWTKYFKNIDSLICYTTDNKGSVLRNLVTGNEITLFGTDISNSNIWGVDADNIYLSHKLNNEDEYYNIFRINKTTLNAEIIPGTQSTSRITNAFYTYNRDLCVFYENQIISLQGELLANFMKTMLTNPSISGIDRINEYMYKASFADYNLEISSDKFTAYVPTYTYFCYSSITELPVQNDICLVTEYINSNAKNNNTSLYKYQSLVITDVARSNEVLINRIVELEKELAVVNRKVNTIRGE